MTFEAFLTMMAAIPTLSCILAIRTILAIDKHPILLCVDEIIKSPNPGKAAAVGDCLSSLEASDFNSVISMLDWLPVKDVYKKKSQRDVVPVTLPLLTKEESEKLFPADSTQIVKRLITYCNSHPRSLSILKGLE